MFYLFSFHFSDSLRTNKCDKKHLSRSESTGITFQYPSDWKVTSKEYADAMLGNDGGMNNGLNQDPKLVKPIALLLPESLDGSSFLILSELLPFPVPIEKYTDLTRNSLLTDPTIKLSDNLPISLGNMSGLKYNVTSTSDPYLQTQILFVNDSNAFVVGYTVGETKKSQNIMDINSMIDSFKNSNNNISALLLCKEIIIELIHTAWLPSPPESKHHFVHHFKDILDKDSFMSICNPLSLTILRYKLVQKF
ncbi:MAG: hypothetical protein P0116_12070 [Candidatus Nitrosocosmicus sp.]|nr:hypothetical protein [Candidatus Nitrosocosmicus sp.]